MVSRTQTEMEFTASGRVSDRAAILGNSASFDQQAVTDGSVSCSDTSNVALRCSREPETMVMHKCCACAHN